MLKTSAIVKSYGIFDMVIMCAKQQSYVMSYTTNVKQLPCFIIYSLPMDIQNSIPYMKYVEGI